MLGPLTQQLHEKMDLTATQARCAVGCLIDEQVPSETKAAFLTALANKGETTDEIAAFARELREKSLQPPLDAATRACEIIDVCGTGGDRLGTFNISTTVAIVVAAAGVVVAKHGNRAITSRAGSADVLEALGVPIDLEPETAAKCLRDHGFAFFFAPKYHPAFRHIGPARRLCAQRGQRTIFNFLGPLLNPARPSAQLVGVPDPALCEPMARVLQMLGVRRGMVVAGQVQDPAPTHGSEAGAQTTQAASPAASGGAPALWLDEFSTLGESRIAEFYQDRALNVSSFRATNLEADRHPARLADLAGGDRDQNAAIIRQVLNGHERGPKRDAVLLNAGAALFVAARVRSLTEGWELAAQLIDGGRAHAKLEALSKYGPAV